MLSNVKTGGEYDLSEKCSWMNFPQASLSFESSQVVLPSHECHCLGFLQGQSSCRHIFGEDLGL